LKHRHFEAGLCCLYLYDAAKQSEIHGATARPVTPTFDDYAPSPDQDDVLTSTETKTKKQRLRGAGGEHALLPNKHREEPQYKHTKPENWPSMSSKHQKNWRKPAQWDSINRKARKNWMAKQAKHLLYLNGQWNALSFLLRSRP
jgi:hypothetical protein